jgi:[CysO sulfur-carrier protein]-S-L-cysteine hydrolase
MSFRLSVPQTLHDEMVAQAVREAPNECCGLFAGVVRDGVAYVERIYPLVNAAASPVLYESDVRSIKTAYLDIDRRKLDLLAVYHSHPTSMPVPSKTDLELNVSEEIVSLIVSLAVDPPLVRGWWLTATAYREAVWEVV